MGKRATMRMVGIAGVIAWGASAGAGQVVTARLAAGSDELRVHALDSGAQVIVLDLSAYRGRSIVEARLRLERDPVDGATEDALVGARISELTEPFVAGRPLPPSGDDLALLAPWYRDFDATAAVRRRVRAGGEGLAALVHPLPGLRPGKIVVDLTFEADPGDAPTPLPPQPTGLRVLHRAGQTFVTWLEVETRIEADPVTWGTLEAALTSLDREREVRYRLYRHSEPITARTLREAELLAEVAPLSAYNVEGRSLEALIYLHRRRSSEDIGFARELARKWYFGEYSIDMPEMAEVTVERFVIDDGGAPLPLGSGLYVHQPAEAGESHYAVVTAVDGVANTIDLSGENATRRPIEESVGTGVPVFQAAGTLRVFWDYPGERRYYVQWCAPPLANRPNRYYNWSIFVPAGRPSPAPVRVFLGKDQYMRPTTPHRRDTILVSGRDGPVRSFWYGYHECLGTLRSFRDGVVQPYTRRRLFALVEWVMEELDGDPMRLSAVGGTEALYYGVKHGERFAYILANEPDPDVREAPEEVRIQNYVRRPPRREREAVWGRVEWAIPNADGIPAWDEFDLISCVREDPRREIAFLSLGPASLSAAWSRQAAFMKVLWEAKQPFVARFYWGGGEYLPLPETETVYRRSGSVLDLALDLPMLALRNNSNDRGIDEKPFVEEEPRYWSGGRIADGRRWLSDLVDTPSRFEVTIHGRGRVAYAGGGTSDVTPRRTRKFRPDPGEDLAWENVDVASGKVLQSGRVEADELGLVTIPRVTFQGEDSRLRIWRLEASTSTREAPR